MPSTAGRSGHLRRTKYAKSDSVGSYLVVGFRKSSSNSLGSTAAAVEVVAANSHQRKLRRHTTKQHVEPNHIPQRLDAEVAAQSIVQRRGDGAPPVAAEAENFVYHQELDLRALWAYWALDGDNVGHQLKDARALQVQKLCKVTEAKP